MLKNAKGDIVKIYPQKIKELVYYGYPSEEELKTLYENGFILIRIKDNRYYFIDKNGD